MAEALHIQINDHDTYHELPLSLDLMQGATKVPIIRIYGSLRVRTSQDLAYNVLVHVHNYYPYVYLDWWGHDESAITDDELRDFKLYLETCMKASFKRNHDIDSDADSDVDRYEILLRGRNKTKVDSYYIASIVLCKGVPVYGYHLGYSTKVKILFLLPHYKTRFTRLLNERKIDFGKFFVKEKKSIFTPNIYEAHINFLTQFMADFNLYGCGWLEIDSCFFRSPITTPNRVDIAPLKKYLQPYITSENILSSESFPRMGRTLLEIDVSTHNIMNWKKLKQRNIHNDFSEVNMVPNANEIYLTSLESTFNELKYQCDIRKASQTSQLLHKLYSQVFPKIGVGGFHEWEAYNYTVELLSYMKTLNKPTKFSNVHDYYENIIRPTLRNTLLPTCFDVIERTSSTNSQVSHKFDVHDDLLRWDNYDMLFEPLENVSELLIEEILPSEKRAYKITDQDNSISAAPISVLETPLQNADVLKSSNVPSVVSLDVSPKTHMTGLYSNSLDGHSNPLTEKEHPVSHDTNQSGLDHLFSQTLDFLVCRSNDLWEFLVPLKLRKQLFKQTMLASPILDIEYSEPSYYLKQDLHPNPLIFANKKIVVPYNGEGSKKPINVGNNTPNWDVINDEPLNNVKCKISWEFMPRAPSRNEIIRWIEVDEKKQAYKANRFKSQIEPAITQTNDFKYSHRISKLNRNPSGYLNLSMLYMEVHADTESPCRPDPLKDPITMIIYRFDDSNHMFPDEYSTNRILFCCNKDFVQTKRQLKIVSLNLTLHIECFRTEMEMVDSFLLRVDLFDPEILGGYEINASSWGYLIERMQNVYAINILSRLSRTKIKGNGRYGDRWGFTHTSAIKINGRHLINVWRILKSEVNLTSYSLENLSFNLLHQTMPRFSNLELTNWRRGGAIQELIMFCEYYSTRLNSALLITDSREIIIKNVEQSRLIGIDFNSNFYRGSQYKVESILIRIAKSENVLLNSPSKQQVHEMRALDAIPLIMEPEANFYKSPLVVLDFQSLYPSIMIAYNYCYSTLIGKAEGFRQDKNAVGYLKHHNLPLGIVDILDKNGGITISPNGLVFVSSKFRKSLLSKMLQEILNMRINVKSVASAFQNDDDLLKVCNSKQLALKLIANVTYGYTSATFSGRMPNSDIADAIVASGREILSKSIQIIEDSEFNAKVVYGDTDSLFIYFPGRSKTDAFSFGKILAQRVTDFFPDPIKLKFEKVYHPCVLLAKKRYVGNCFESETQTLSTFEAKGIETIRRDGIPAQLKMVGKTIRILFETKNLSQVKEYVVKQFYKVLFNRVNIKDFCFAKEVRYGTYKNEKYLPPGAIIAAKAVKRDPRSEPQYRERVPYLVIKDPTKERIKDRCVSPEEYVESFKSDCPLELDFEYYISRVLIPPLERVFNLMGVDIKDWYRTMPKLPKQSLFKRNDILRISGFLQRRECLHCGNSLESQDLFLCIECMKNKSESVNDLISTNQQSNKVRNKYEILCQKCNIKNFGRAARSGFEQACKNTDCELFYAKAKAVMENDVLISEISQVLESLQW